MGIYVGVDGAVRNIKGVDAGKSSVRHVVDAYVGINGAVRKTYNMLDDIDYVKVNFEKSEVQNCSSSSGAYGSSENSLSLCNQYGSVSISGSSARVECNTEGKHISIYAKMYVVFKDGHKVDLRFIANNLQKPIRIYVSYYIKNSATGGNNGGWYGSYIYDAEMFNGIIYDTGSESGSQTIYDAENSSWGAFIAAGISSGCGGYMVSEQTYNSITIDGRSFSMRAENNLP